jgi:hypothetical protein
MTLIIQKPTGAKLVLRKELPADAEADAYIAAVEAADGQSLESGVKFAIKNFVLCCKDDGIWTSIKASCILAGARTLAGALVPLVGAAPTNFNFVAGDYDRETGLVGDGINKTIDSGRANNADPQNDNHNAVFASSVNLGQALIGGGDSGGVNLISPAVVRCRTSLGTFGSTATGFQGASRSSSASFIFRAGRISTTAVFASSTPSTGNIFINSRRGVDAFSLHRIAFYSIGESLNLALLDARVTDLINAFAAAIP